MSCRRIHHLIGPYVAGTLDDAERQTVLQHLGGCTACAALVRQQRVALAALASLPRTTPSLGVRQAILNSQSPTMSRRTVLRSSAKLATLAGGGLLAALVLARFGRAAGDRSRAGSASSSVILPGAQCPNPTTAAMQRLARPPRTPIPGTAATLAPAGHATLASVPPGYAKTAENRSLALYVERTAAQLAVQDKRNGLVWLSNPWQYGQPLLSSNPPTAASNRATQTAAVYFLNYTPAAQRDIVRLMNSAWDATPRHVLGLPDGGSRLRFDLPTIGIAFALDLRLGEGYFDVTLPQSEIVEAPASATSGNLVVSIEPLPFFGAGADDEQGFMLLPDGCGSRVPFARSHDTYLATYTYRHPTVPIFGIVKRANAGRGTAGGAFLGVVTSNTADVSINCEPSGYITLYNRADGQFTYRNPVQVPSATPGRFVTQLSTTVIPGDRTVRYYLLGEKDATYAGLLAQYQAYLKDRH